MEGENGHLTQGVAFEAPDGPTLLFCRFCRQLFHSKARLDTHERIHMGVHKSHPCLICGRGFRQAMYLKFHMQQIHGSSLEDVEVTMETASSIPSRMQSQSSTTVLDAVVMAQNSRVHFTDGVADAPDMAGSHQDSSCEGFVGSTDAVERYGSTCNITGERHQNSTYEDMVDPSVAMAGYHDSSCSVVDPPDPMGPYQSSGYGGMMDNLIAVGRRENSQGQGAMDSPDAIASIMDFAPLFHAEDLPLSFQEDGEAVKVDDLTPSIFSASDSVAADPCAVSTIRMSASVDEDAPCRVRQGSDQMEAPYQVGESLSLDGFSPRSSRKQQTPQKNLPELTGQATPIFQKASNQMARSMALAPDEIHDVHHGHVHEGVPDRLAVDTNVQTSLNQFSSSHTFRINNSQPSICGMRSGLRDASLDTQHDSHMFRGTGTELSDSNLDAPCDAVATSCHPSIKVEPGQWTKEEASDVADESPHEHSFTACEIPSEASAQPYLPSEMSGQNYSTSETTGQPCTSSEISSQQYLSAGASGQLALDQAKAASVSQLGSGIHLPKASQGREFTASHTRVLPSVSGKKKNLVCELCHQAFSGALFLRSHFRVAHGAEIIGIDSDDEEVSGRLNVSSQNSSLTPMKRGKGRPKGSKNKPNGCSPFHQELKVKRPVGRPKGSKNKVKSGGGIHLPLNSLVPVSCVPGMNALVKVKRPVGRPKGSKNKIKREGDVRVPLPRYIPPPHQQVPSMLLSGQHTSLGPPLAPRPPIPGSVPRGPVLDTSPPIKRKRGRPKGSKTRKVLDSLPPSFLLPGPSTGDFTNLVPPLPYVPPISPQGPQMSSVPTSVPNVTTAQTTGSQHVLPLAVTSPPVKKKRGRPKGSKTRKFLYSFPTQCILPFQSVVTATGLVQHLPYIAPISPQEPEMSKSPANDSTHFPTFSPLAGPDDSLQSVAETSTPVKKKRGRPKGSKTRQVLDSLPLSYVLPSQATGDVKLPENRGIEKPRDITNKPKSPSEVKQDTFCAPVPNCVTLLPAVKRGRGRPKGSKTINRGKKYLKNCWSGGLKGFKKRGRPLGKKNAELKSDSSKKVIIVKFTGRANAKVRSEPSSGAIPLEIKEEPADDKPVETDDISSDEERENSNSLSGKNSEKSNSRSHNWKDVNSGLTPQATDALLHLKKTEERDVSNREIEAFIDNTKQEEPSSKPEKQKKVEGLTCEICNRTVARKSDIVRHMRTHTGEKPFACNVCGRRFGDRSHLRDHLKLHSGERKYVCKVCGKAFAQSNGLVSHAAIHQEKKFGCKICSKKFTRKTDVQRHIRLHAGLKPISCHVCQKRFANASNLNSHLKVHSAPKYKCELCQRMFARKSDVNRHLRTFHRGAEAS